jgi:SAM-dependent methyltransferase
MNTTSQQFFDRMYQQNPDPWRFASSPYELHRYETILRALEHRRYRRAFEPGCSIGVLTEQLATLCDHVDALDISPTATALARQRCASLSRVNIACGSLADGIPASFDLLVFCEVGYYFAQDQLHALLLRCLANLQLDGTLLASHWLRSSPDHVLSGDAVHEIVAALPGLELELSERHVDFRLDRWRKTCETPL